MTEIEQLHTGQVPFISGLMAGFAITMAGQILRSKAKGWVAMTSFILFSVCSLLYIVALYIEVGLILRSAGLESFSETMINRITFLRTISTSSTTIATFLFVATIGLMAWVQSRWAGMVTSVFALMAFIALLVSRHLIFGLN